MANQEQLDILKQGVEAWNQWRKEHPDVKTDLRGADLGSADLGDANLSRADLSGVNLSGATIGWTIFGNVDLSGAKGLETEKYEGPSTIGIDTIYRSQGNIPEVFFKGAGVDTDSYKPCLPCAVSSGIKLVPMWQRCAQNKPVLLFMHLFVPGIIAHRSKLSYESVSTRSHTHLFIRNTSDAKADE